MLQVFASHCLSPSAKLSVDPLQCFQIFLDTPLWKTQIQFLQSLSVMNSAPRMPCTICAVLCIQFAVEVFGLIHVKVTVMVSLDSTDIMLNPFSHLKCMCRYFIQFYEHKTALFYLTRIIKMPCLKFIKHFFLLNYWLFWGMNGYISMYFYFWKSSVKAMQEHIISTNGRKKSCSELFSPSE